VFIANFNILIIESIAIPAPPTHCDGSTHEWMGWTTITAIRMAEATGSTITSVVM
jgi:hypothetical protein